MVKRRVKILFTIPNFTTAGSGREMMNIIDRLDQSLFEIFICVETEGGEIYKEAIEKGYILFVNKFTAHNASGLISIIKESRKLSANFKKYSFDIWQSFNWSSDFSEALIARFSGAKYVYVKKNMNWDRTAWKVKSFLATAIVARNTTMCNLFFRAPYLNRKTFFIPGGVDTTKFHKTGDTTLRQHYKISTDAILITCVAQLVRVKDQKTLIGAIAELNNVYLILAGVARDEIYTNELYSMIKKLRLEERVVVAGPVKKINELLNASDIFVLPTTDIGGHEEGSPVALIEAMAAGVPCIASNVAGNRDLVYTNQTGLLFAPNNEKELAACITRYVTDTEFAQKMAANAKQVVLKENTLDIETMAFTKMYKKITSIR